MADGQSSFVYGQAMCVLAAPVLYCMGEVEGFFAFKRLISAVCPTYLHRDRNKGVLAGCYLVFDVLKVADPELYDALVPKRGKGFTIDTPRLVGFKRTF